MDDNADKNTVKRKKKKENRAVSGNDCRDMT